MSAEMDYKCYHCAQTFSKFNEIIDHNIIYHCEVHLKFKRHVQGSNQKTYFWQTKSSNIIPVEVKDNGCFIYPEGPTETIKVSKLGRADDSFLLSPILKKQKLVTSTPVKKSLFDCPQISDNDPNETFTDMEVDDIANENEPDLLSDMVNLSIADGGVRTHIGALVVLLYQIILHVGANILPFVKNCFHVLFKLLV